MERSQRAEALPPMVGIRLHTESENVLAQNCAASSTSQTQTVLFQT